MGEDMKDTKKLLAQYEAAKEVAETLAHRFGAEIEWDEEGFPSLTFPDTCRLHYPGSAAGDSCTWAKNRLARR